MPDCCIGSHLLEDCKGSGGPHVTEMHSHGERHPMVDCEAEFEKCKERLKKPAKGAQRIRCETDEGAGTQGLRALACQSHRAGWGEGDKEAMKEEDIG